MSDVIFLKGWSAKFGLETHGHVWLRRQGEHRKWGTRGLVAPANVRVGRPPDSSVGGLLARLAGEREGWPGWLIVSRGEDQERRIRGGRHMAWQGMSH